MKLFALILAVAMMLSLALPASATDATLPEGMEWMTPFDETVKLNVVVGWDADSGVKEGTTPEIPVDGSQRSVVRASCAANQLRRHSRHRHAGKRILL